MTKREHLAEVLQDRTEPELKAILYSVVPYPRQFLIDEICAYATNAEVQKLLESYGDEPSRPDSAAVAMAAQTQADLEGTLQRSICEINGRDVSRSQHQQLSDSIHPDNGVVLRGVFNERSSLRRMRQDDSE